MATGVKPRDDDISFSRSDLDAIQDAMKNKKFRELLADYCEEVRDPANQALYQKEMVQLEKERGYNVTFINPKGGYVIKTSVAGDRKAFINICCNDNVGKPSYQVQEKDGKKGMNWAIPYSMIPPREDFDHKRERCVIYDVVFHPDTLRMAEVNKQFRELVNKTALEGLQDTYKIHFDSNNFRFPKSHYKGISNAAVIRKEDPDFKPPTDEDDEVFTPEMLEKLYPQHIYSNSKKNNGINDKFSKDKEIVTAVQHARKLRNEKAEFSHKSEEGYTIPKYVIKQQKNVDMQEFTYHRDSKQHSAIPNQIVVEISLPLLSSTKNCELDVKEKFLTLVSEKPAKYKLEIPLPYFVNDECGNAKFDKSKHKLIVTLPVVKQSLSSEINSKVDSGVESEENSGSQSDEDHPNLISELSSTPSETTIPAVEISKPQSKSNSFFDTSLGYILPPYTHNVLDDIVAFTFHVKNTEPDSVQVKNDENRIFMKFTSMGSGFVPVHYAAVLSFDDNIQFGNVSGEAWDNNVILQLELAGDIPKKFNIGLDSDSMVSEYFDMSQIKQGPEQVEAKKTPEEGTPVVEVTNLGIETNIVVSSSTGDYDEDDDVESSVNEREIVWTESYSETGAKSILRKPISMIRSFSESSAGDMASSIDYISSDYIPEESSYKKTVRFNNVISKQFYRYNSSIEGQKKKNQRKKSKKRNLERRKSESEAEDDSNNNTQQSKPKTAMKLRRDSGLADTSDPDEECKNSQDEGSYTPIKEDITNEQLTKSMLNIVDHDDKKTHEICVSKTEKVKKSKPINCEPFKHNTDLYNPDKLNKGQYPEVTFKNDLIFDLDM